jgi:hypothetical protein
MVDRVEEMVREREAPSVRFLKFITLAAQNPRKIICFFEGEDRKYFGIRIDLSKIGSEWAGMDCGGKKNVLALHAQITAHTDYKHSPIAFFVDKDFDPPLPTTIRPLVYETPCYSIENLYCTPTCLARVLDIEFKLGNHATKHDLLEKAVMYFQETLQQFLVAIRPLNIWIKAHRIKEAKEGQKPLNAGNVGLDKLVKFENGVVKACYDAKSIHSFYPEGYTLSDDELKEAEALLPVPNSHLAFRGKYQLEFVRKFLEKFREECASPSSFFYNPKNVVKLSLSKGNFISELSQHADTPQCLRDFLEAIANSPSATKARQSAA